MANEASGRKSRKSQKRKDRQERRREKQVKTAEKQKEIQVNVKKTKKSLPGFLAKNAENILKWLGAYCTLFCRADDYGIDKLDRYSPEQRKDLVQMYVDISDFRQIVREMLNANDVKNSEIMEIQENTENIENKQIEEINPAIADS